MHILKVKLRIIAKRTPWLYRPLKKLRDKDASEKICTKKSNICVEGCPCSANTFTAMLLEEIRKDFDVAQRCHSIANLKLALKLNIPAIALIRHPKDCVSSRIVRLKSSLDESLLEYIDFCNFVLKNRNKLLIALFNDVTKNTENFLTEVSNKTGLALDYKDINKVQERVFKTMKEIQRKKSIPKNIGLPTKERERQKILVKKHVIKSPYYSKAIKLYNEILNLKK
jgi:hypothetical protein